ncbi:MAG: CCA tRNA nucleotidyltransferase, partial [Candidatus Micrarchaeia archaeon]
MIVGRDYKKVLDSVLKKIEPSEEEIAEHRKFMEEIAKKLNEMTPKDIEIKPVGSIAKGTFLKGDTDYDIFILFPKTYYIKDVETLGIKWAKEFVRKFKAKRKKVEVAYAQHPYLRAFIDGKEIDFVPSYKITSGEEVETAVDRSQLHTEYIKEKMKKGMENEVRLLKQFLKGIGIYGAEGKVMGFSGYLCELLILKFGSFLNLLSSCEKWKNPCFDIEHGMSETEMKEKFKNSAMVFVDPVDKNRNVAAAVSNTSLSIFIYSARQFLRNPSEKFFFPVKKKVNKKWMNKQLKLRDSKIYLLEFEKPQIVEDILWPQIYKLSSKISEYSKMFNFSVFDIYPFEKNGKIGMIIEYEIHSLPKMVKIYGPPIYMTESVERFIEKNKVTEPVWIENDKILAIGKRKFVSAKDLLQYLLKTREGFPPDLKKLKMKLYDVNYVVKKYPEFLYS